MLIKDLEQARADAEILRKENAKLKTRLTELEGNLQQVRQERDQLKVAAAKPAPAPAPAKKTGTAARK